MANQTPITREEYQALAHRTGVLEDKEAITRLQYAYGYYLDKCLYDEVVDLFSDHGSIVFAGGLYKGKAGLKRLYFDRFRQNFTNGHNGPIYGFLLDHQQSQQIIDVADDRKTAKARFRCFMQAGSHITKEGPVMAGLQQWWEGGIYENDYINEDGIWKIKQLDYNVVYHGTFEEGWAHWKPVNWTATKTFPEDPAGPDEILPERKYWPETPTIPFHYPHPVTGKPWKG